MLVKKMTDQSPGIVLLLFWCSMSVWPSCRCSSSLVLLKYKLLDAQQREVILTKKCGEMETEVKVAKRETRSIQERNAELQKLLTIEKVWLSYHVWQCCYSWLFVGRNKDQKWCYSETGEKTNFYHQGIKQSNASFYDLFVQCAGERRLCQCTQFIQTRRRSRTDSERTD